MSCFLAIFFAYKARRVKLHVSFLICTAFLAAKFVRAGGSFDVCGRLVRTAGSVYQTHNEKIALRIG